MDRLTCADFTERAFEAWEREQTLAARGSQLNIIEEES